jgi:hypothetical protein
MKQFLLVLTLLLSIATLTSHSQEIIISYTYDLAGNRISRDTIIIGGGGKGSNDLKEEKKESDKVINDETFATGTVKIYPNPTQGLIEIEVPVSEDNYELQIIVTDINGRKIIDENSKPPRTIVDLSNQPGGMYILILKQGETYSKWKIIKK